MALDDSELDPDEVDLEVNKPYAWYKARKHWEMYLSEWEKEIYYPIFAPRGISKGHALTSYIAKTEIVDIYNLLVYKMKEDSKEDDGDSWNKQK